MGTKICLTPRQSKKFIKLGLDFNTADMYYSLKNPIHAEVLYNHCDKSFFDIREWIPAWSLNALLNLMPSIIRLRDHSFTIHIGKLADEEHWYISYEWEGHVYQVSKGTLINAAFEMVVWLIEQRHIKTNKQ